MFQQLLRKIGGIQPILRVPEQTRPLCSMATRSSIVTKRQEHCSNSIHQSIQSRSICSISPLGDSVLKTEECNSILKSEKCDRILQSSVTAPLNNLIFVRTHLRRHYQPSAIKRMRKHGLEKRISARSQREILFRRIIAGRETLTTFDRFPNEIPDARKKTTKRVNLFDPKSGYKSVLKKKEKFIFKEI